VKEGCQNIPDNREDLFQLLYGYPIKFAEQIVAGVDPTISKELIKFHQSRLRSIDVLLSSNPVDGSMDGEPKQ
jgi:hypothetical protein